VDRWNFALEEIQSRCLMNKQEGKVDLEGIEGVHQFMEDHRMGQKLQDPLRYIPYPQKVDKQIEQEEIRMKELLKTVDRVQAMEFTQRP